jgi:hypothetical protein
MKLARHKCDQCGAENDITKTSFEIRKVAQIYVPQIERDAPSTVMTSEPLMVLSVYDFCSVKCVTAWCTETGANL